MHSGHFRFWRQHISQFGIWLWPIYPVNWKAASFELGPGQEKALQQVQAATQADAAGAVVPGVSGRQGCCVQPFAAPLVTQGTGS